MTVLEIDSVVFCESIRQEIGGKHTLLGASANDLTVNSLPGAISCAFFVVGRPSAIGKIEGEFRALGPDGAVLIGGNFGGEFVDLVSTSFPLGPFPLSLGSEGKYLVEWKFVGSEKWTNIAELQIRLASPLTQQVS